MYDAMASKFSNNIQISLSRSYLDKLTTLSLEGESPGLTVKRLIINLLDGVSTTTSITTSNNEDYQERIEDLEHKVESLSELVESSIATASRNSLPTDYQERIEGLELKLTQALKSSQCALEERILEKFTRLELWIKKVEQLATPITDSSLLAENDEIKKDEPIKPARKSRTKAND
jgi:HD-GYP domain-containing protein (c-di-GMP phosphodiesterase class II)